MNCITEKVLKQKIRYLHLTVQFGVIAGVAPFENFVYFCGGLLRRGNVCSPATTPSCRALGASGGQRNGGERLKASSGNVYGEVVTRKISVPNPFSKAENLCLTQRQDTREAVRARL
jgi:hypothetical protein